MAKIRISDDKMMAFIRFYPPSKNGDYMSEQDILNELTKAKVIYGISPKVLKACLMAKQYCRDIPIAKGKAVVPGKNARIVYQFNTTPTAKPKLLEDGSVDFHELNLFTSVKEGDLLAELIPESEGEPGKDIFGNVVYPSKVQRAVLKFGRNIQLSEDKTKLYSEVNGDVKLEGEIGRAHV